MNILVVAHYQNDGSPTACFIHDQILAYTKLGHRVLAIVPIPIGKCALNGKRWEFHAHRENIAGVEHWFVRYFSLSNYGANNGFNSHSAIGALKHLLPKALGTFKPDVIHAHTLGFDSAIGAWLKGKLHCPLVVTTHGSDTTIPIREGHPERVKRAADAADVVVAVSSSLQRKLIEVGAGVRTAVILNGFNVNYAAAEQNRSPVSIVQVGHLIEQKKVDITIRAFQKIKASYPEATLHVIGSGRELSALQELCRQMGLLDSVRFFGEIPNQAVLAEMAKARFFVMPSVREGFGIVYLEAMACGCVTIGTAGEGIADFIVDGENGFLVPPESPDAIVEKIEACLTKPEWADEIAARGQQAARAMTWEKNARQIERLFVELVKDHAN